MGANRWILFAGLALVIGGGLLLAGNLFNFNAWLFCWPVGLILLGVWFVLRPTTSLPGGVATFRLIGEVHRSGSWKVVNEELSQLIGDIHLDLTRAEMAPGETRLRINGFVGDVHLTIPAGVGLSMSGPGFISNINFLGQHRDYIFTPVQLSTPGYASAEHQLRLEFNFFITDLSIRQG